MIVFRYRKERSTLLGIIYRPVAEVYFRDTHGGELVSLMYIDSGADITLIPKALGESLGFEVKEKDIREVTGIGNARVHVLIRKTKIRIGDIELEAKIAWALEEGVPPLLGRADIFDKFDIIFREENKIIEFREKSS